MAWRWEGIAAEPRLGRNSGFARSASPRSELPCAQSENVGGLSADFESCRQGSRGRGD